ncbi:hypothetical protein HZS_2293 [Henneguya salminicola]|nr:hypothetical protein HZS_2293 [Henneguya salminicola]
MEIIGKTNEVSKKDQTISDFIQTHIRDNAETLEKMPFKVYEELLINMRKHIFRENLQNSTKK